MITQRYIGTTREVNSPKYITGAHQTRDRVDTANKNNNIAILDHLNLAKCYVEIDGQRYPRDGFLVNYDRNDYTEQYKVLKLFFKDTLEKI